MPKTMLSIKTDANLKKKAQKVAKEAGVPISLVVNNALKEFIERRSITIQAPLVPNAKTGRALKRAIARIESGEEKLAGPFKTGKEMIDYLNS